MRPAALALSLAVALAALPLGARPAAAATLNTQLDALTRSFAGGSGVWVSDPTIVQPLYTHDPDHEVITASLYKLAVLLEAEHQVEDHRLSYGDVITIDPEDITADGSYEAPGTELTLDEALEAMITISDNGTARHLWRMLGPANINAYLDKSGIKGFHVASSEEEDNVATPRAIGTFFTLLANKMLISTTASDRMLKRLGRQEINDRIPAQLPEGTVVAHKTGNLVGAVHDAGILFLPRGQRVLVAMTWDVDDETANEFIAHLASAVYTSAIAPPVSAQYSVPQDAQYIQVGTSAALPVTIANAGEEAWTIAGTSQVGLTWELRDGANNVVQRAPRSLPLGRVAPGASISMPVVITAPNRAGDAKLVLGLVDSTGKALAAAGVATATVPVRIHLPFVARGSIHIPSSLHRREASMVEVDWEAVAPVRSDDHVLSLGWRIKDPATDRIVAQGSQPLGTMKTYERSGAFFAPLVAPNVRGTYTLEYELRERGSIAGVTTQQAVEILPPRTYGDEAGPPPSLLRPPQPRPSPSPSPRPSATPSPRPTARP
jgi:beta-lactamase class A